MTGYPLLRMRVIALALGLTVIANFGKSVDYKSDILPLMQQYCWDCHSNETSVKGSLALDDFAEMMEFQIGKYNIIVPGDAEGSNFYTRMLLDPNKRDFMPRNASAVPEKDLALIAEWINQGAVIDADNVSEMEKERMPAGVTPGKGLDTEAFHTWTSPQGKEIEARFLGFVGEKIRLVRSDGKAFEVPREFLSADSVALAQQIADARTAR